jgi:hypothetical protein
LGDGFEGAYVTDYSRAWEVVMALDTMSLEQALEALGMPRPQAAAVVVGIREAHADLVTKQDLTAAMAELKAEIHSSSSRTIMWVAGVVVLGQVLPGMLQQLPALVRSFGAGL